MKSRRDIKHFGAVAFAILLLMYSLKSFASNSCANLLTSGSAVVSVLEGMYKRGQLTASDLLAIRAEKNPLVNRNSIDGHTFVGVIALVIDRLKHNREAQSMLEEFIRTVEAQSQNHRVLVSETAKPFLAMTLYKITDENSYAADIPVTQWQYAFVMRHLKEPNPSNWKNGPRERMANIAGRDILMQPNNPVEMVTWFEAQKFIRVLNKWSKQNNHLIYRIIQNHIPFARFRLLTNRDWDNLLRGGDDCNEKYPYGVTANSLNRFAWYAENSDKTTHPVAELNSIDVSGHAFYDLLGNVWEWSDEREGETRVARGGCYYERAINLQWDSRLGLYPDLKYPAVGFRIAEDPP